MPASDWLAPEVVQELEARFGTPDDALKVAFARLGIGDELFALGVRDVSGFGATEFLMPPEIERYVWARIAEELLGAQTGARASPSSSPIVEPDLSGRPLPALAVLRALRLFASPDVKIRQVVTADFSYRSARRVHSWVASGALRWDRTRTKPIPTPGYDLVTGGTKDKPTLQLIRI